MLRVIMIGERKKCRRTRKRRGRVRAPIRVRRFRRRQPCPGPSPIRAADRDSGHMRGGGLIKAGSGVREEGGGGGLEGSLAARGGRPCKWNRSGPDLTGLDRPSPACHLVVLR